MSRDPRHDILFEEVRIGPKTMRNRFYQSPHCTSLGTEFPLAHSGLRAMKAEGGWAVVNTEYCSVHPSSDSTPLLGSRLWDDEDVRKLEVMVDAAHEHGALVGVELWAGGFVAGNLESRMPARGASQATETGTYAGGCYELDKAGIREVQRHYVDAAKRALRAGFDIINIQGAENGAIPTHFLMSRHNQRTDEYGGSFENRARFWLETLEQVREAVGDECAITTRLCVDTLNDSPLGIRAGIEGYDFIKLADHLVDFWDLQTGGWNVEEWAGDDAVPSRFGPQWHQRDHIAAARAATKKPVAAVGRFTDPNIMAEAVRSGVIDIIAAARPSIADPFLPKKIEEGRYDQIRECIGCNICASRFPQSAPIICTQNATLGEEYRRGWHPEKFTKAANSDQSVLVVGAGPAGAECARILGERGMEMVHLVDAQDEVGGSLRRISTYPGLGEWARHIDYRKIQLERLPNVEVILGTTLSAEDVLDYGADIVVIATGSYWRSDGAHEAPLTAIPGADQDFVFTPADVSDVDGDIPGEHVVVFDADGYFTGVGMAQMLHKRGKKVTFVTPFAELAPYMFLTGEGYRVNRELRTDGIEVVTHFDITSIEPGRVVGENSWAAHLEAEWSADAVVLVTKREPRNELYNELVADSDRLAAAGIKGLYRIGDCVAPRLIADCTFDGHRLAREIDSPDPAEPLPYKRESRRLLPVVEVSS
jgi:dimethylamine/trimethylamine dehydrogenase